MSVSGVIQILRTNSVTNRIQDFSEWSAAQYEKLGGGGGGGSDSKSGGGWGGCCPLQARVIRKVGAFVWHTVFTNYVIVIIT